MCDCFEVVECLSLIVVFKLSFLMSCILPHCISHPSAPHHSNEIEGIKTVLINVWWTGNLQSWQPTLLQRYIAQHALGHTRIGKLYRSGSFRQCVFHSFFAALWKLNLEQLWENTAIQAGSTNTSKKWSITTNLLLRTIPLCLCHNNFNCPYFMTAPH